MAEKFDSPFANGEGNKRRPTANERLNGFECGPADRELFNWLHHTVQAELGHLIGYAGLTDSPDDLQQVRKAIEALIASATGTGATSDYILMNQARSRLLFYPEVLNSADGKINLTVPTGGQVRVASGVSILHRGIHQMSTSDFDELSRTFSTVASKTYHVRMNMAPGAEALSINDLADSGYNSGSLAESDPSFDSTYDDMLIARVVTNASNVATITPLANWHRLVASYGDTVDFGVVEADKLPTAGQYGNDTVLNWSRTPDVSLTKIGTIGAGYRTAGGVDVGGGVDGISPDRVIDRYGVKIGVHVHNARNHNTSITATYGVVARA